MVLCDISFIQFSLYWRSLLVSISGKFPLCCFPFQILARKCKEFAESQCQHLLLICSHSTLKRIICQYSKVSILLHTISLFHFELRGGCLGDLFWVWCNVMYNLMWWFCSFPCVGANSCIAWAELDHITKPLINLSHHLLPLQAKCRFLLD